MSPSFDPPRPPSTPMPPNSGFREVLSDPEIHDHRPLFSSRIAKTYLEFISRYYPEVDIDAVLGHAEMTRYEVDDPAHWFTQDQVDRFHEILVEKTGNPSVSREAGRYAASSEAIGPVRQYALGFLSPSTAYRLTEKIIPHLSRAHTFKTARLGTNRVEVIATLKPGMPEKPYQCENRIGHLESIAKLFTGKYARVEHPVCVHRGGEFCRYVIMWEGSASLIWRRIRNYSLALFTLFSLVLSFLMPLGGLALPLAVLAFVVTALSLVAERVEKKELIEVLKMQGDAAKDHLEEINIRYNNARLIQEVGQATSRILEVDAIVSTVVSVMKERLDFDRGMIMLADPDKTRLIYAGGFGYGRGQEELLDETEFHLNNPKSRGVFVLAFKEQRPFLINRIEEFEKTFSRRSMELARKMDVRSLVVAPIVYEKESFGILAVDHVRSRRPLTDSDMRVLMGVASQTAVSIANARSFKSLKESERKYRELVENANSIILRRDPEGLVTYFNEYAQRFFGYREEEILGRNVIGTIVPETDSSGRDLSAMIRNISLHPGRYTTNENENVRRNGERVWIAWTNKAIRDPEGKIREILCIGNDITNLKRAEQEKKDLEAKLQRAQKMEAIGTLAGGVAHDLNNILSGLVSYPELLLMDLPEDSALIRPIHIIQQSGERAAAIVQDLLTLARRGVPTSEIVNLNDIVADYMDSPECESLRLAYPEVQIDVKLERKLMNIMGSPVHLSKTVLNLVVNAAEAVTDRGRISIVTENRYVDLPIRGYDDVQEGDYVTLTVSDTGIGIPPGDLERIFEPFYTKKVMGRSGTGLGMAVVWGTMKDHKGYIDVESTEGEGSTFTLYFPVTRREATAGKTPLSLKEFSGRGESVLVVDDVEEQREIAGGMLRRLGYSVATVPSGEEALEYLRNRSADIMVIDMLMDPGIDGLETYRKVLQFSPGQKAIIASGYSETERVKEAQRLGAGTYLKKPYTLEKLGLALRRELRGGSR